MGITHVKSLPRAVRSGALAAQADAKTVRIASVGDTGQPGSQILRRSVGKSDCSLQF
jgi:hypothetical protein